MRRLPFRANYHEPILIGRKRGTVRRGRWRLDPGERVVATFPRRAPLVLAIERVSYLHARSLTREDALRDGFDGLADLRARLALTYPDLAPDDLITVLRFTLDREATDAHHPPELQRA